jgi:hypothetical protein
MNLSAIIMDLERIARDYENKMIRPEQVAEQLEHNAELLFRLAGRIRHGRES